jgi:hypothetical protein
MEVAMRRIIGRLLACALVAVVVAGCGARNPPQITVVNNSTSALSEIRLSGIGFKQVIDKIEPNESKTVTVLPDGESSVTLDAITPVRHITAEGLGYFERRGGYVVQITITSNYNVETRVDLSTMH